MKELYRYLPEEPGVYIMKDSREKVLYVGKAKNLKKRVSSYFTAGRDIKTRVLVKHIRWIDHIVADNEYEALLLENSLIKKWKPRYNIRLKDGKTYPVIRITNEEYPRVFRTRRVIQDGSDYFGPYPDAAQLDTYLEIIEGLFPLRRCRGRLKKREAPCLYYHIGRCAGPCAGKISREEYGRVVNKVRELLTGDGQQLLTTLSRKMEEAAAQLRYEEAARYRDARTAAETVLSRQRVVDFDAATRDYIALASEENLFTFSVFQMREGKLVGRELFREEGAREDGEMLLEFVLQYYDKKEETPAAIYLDIPVDRELLTAYFKREKKAEPLIDSPREGRGRSILQMAHENAAHDLARRKRGRMPAEGLKELQEVFALPKPPRRIEGFDIAQLNGKYPVASLISFYNGIPDKKNYRRFHIKKLEGKIDDYAAVREAVARRYARLLNSQEELPDLVLIDGGRGQVSAARNILNALELPHLPVAGLAKQHEEIFLADRAEPVRLPENSEGLRILQHLRDETHRFATSFNKKLREKDLAFSMLEQIPGIGPARSRRLMQAFGSLQELVDAPVEELVTRGGLPRESARQLKEQLVLPE